MRIALAALWVLAAPLAALADEDGDGYSELQGDCDDHDAQTFPGAIELCDGVDNDCDAVLPEDEWDEDGDGWMPCTDGPDGGDCDDFEAAVHPGADESCNGLDDDCDGAPLEGEEDHDGDGFLACSTEAADCDDLDGDVHPDAGESCNGIDDDCDGVLLEGEEDLDGDASLICDEIAPDCDDADATAAPGFTEICGDGIDNDCDGQIDERCFVSDPPPDPDAYGCAVRLGASEASAGLLLPLFALAPLRRRRSREI